MTEETKATLLGLKAKYEEEAAEAKTIADDVKRPFSQRERAITENVIWLRAGTYIDMLIAGETQLKQVCSWCDDTIREGATIDGLASHGMCQSCFEKEVWKTSKPAST